MAYDKIITLRGRMDHCIDYVLDEEKTALANALSYSENPEKTQRLVTGINCDPETALADMNATKRRWDKKGGVLGYHLIHSYAPGEVTPEEAHSAGVEFAERLLGQRYEAVVCTHTDHDHLHCHIVFNSVSFVDGKKYRSDFKSYFGDIRGTSNEVSRERGLSVIEPEGSGRHYAEWDAERSGKGTIRGLVRQDIDAAVAESFTYDSFLAALRRQGYTIKRGPKVKHTAVRPPGAERFFRLDSLGEGYTEDEIKARLAAVRNGTVYEMPGQATEPKTPPIPLPKKRYHVKHGRLTNTPRPKITGFRALYLRYLYLLAPRRIKRRAAPPSFAVRREITKLHRYERQFRFLMEYRIETDRQLSMLGDALQARIDLLVDYRRELYEQKREGWDVEAEIETINQRLRSVRRELKTCQQITEDIPRIRGQEQQERERQTVQERTKEKTERKEQKNKWM